MNKVVSILFLLSATSAGASVRSFEPDNAFIRPVMMADTQSAADPDLHRSCGDPILLLMKVPDGRMVLLGVFHPKQDC